MKVIQTSHAPKAIGTYSQAVQSGNLVYLSGQLPLDPNTLELCSEEIEPQINQVFRNISALCKASGGSLQDLVKLNIYLVTMKHFSLVNKAMEYFFNAYYPARAIVGVASLPRSALIEVEGIMELSSDVL